MRALISVSDKTGLVELAGELHQLGFEIISTGGTAKKLREAEISVQEVSEFTGFPEILGGRVKTLHPKIFGGILFNRENIHHQSEIRNQDIASIDWVVVNLYPFEKITLEDKISKEEMLEFIDIGGVSLLRAAAKNFKDVVVICYPSDYSAVLEEYKQNQSISLQTKQMLAAKSFAHTACYDSMISKFFRESTLTSHTPSSESEDTPLNRGESFPAELSIGLKKICDLRYGENPQQKAALYKQAGQRNWGVVDAEKLQGKELSFNNYLDLDSAWQIVNSISIPLLRGVDANAPSRFNRDTPQEKGNLQTRCAKEGDVCCVIVKHTNPCGAAIGKNVLESFKQALQSDSASAFGGIVSFSSTVDEATAEEISKSFFECIIAPEYENKALEIFKKKPNLRVLKQPVSLALPYELDFKKISGGVIAQEMDWEPIAEQSRGELIPPYQRQNYQNIGEGWKVVTKRAPTPEEMLSLQFAWQLCRFVKSNAIVLARGTVTCGIGAGQMSRIDSLRIAIQKAESREQNPPSSPLNFKGGYRGVKEENNSTLYALRSTLPVVMASDAFFPFRDCVDEAAKAGISAIIQPGGSIRDAESIEAANQHNIAMVFTGVRHFKH